MWDLEFRGLGLESRDLLAYRYYVDGAMIQVRNIVHRLFNYDCSMFS